MLSRRSCATASQPAFRRGRGRECVRHQPRAFACRASRLRDREPASLLEPEELPKGKAKDEPRVLDREQIGRLLAAAADLYSAALATKVFSGLRVMELLGLQLVVHRLRRRGHAVRHQLTRGSKEGPAEAHRSENERRSA